MIPDPWVAAVLVLAIVRLVRLVSYDHFPPVARLRGWVTGAHDTVTGSLADRQGLTNDPGRVETTHRRPLVYELVSCVWCVGFWIALAVYGCWLAAGHPGDVGGYSSWALYIAAPCALNTAAALVARWLDP